MDRRRLSPREGALRPFCRLNCKMSCIEWLETVLAAWMPPLQAHSDWLKSYIQIQWNVEPVVIRDGGKDLYWWRGDTLYAVIESLEDHDVMRTLLSLSPSHVNVAITNTNTDADADAVTAWLKGVLSAWSVQKHDTTEWVDAWDDFTFHVYSSTPMDADIIRNLRIDNSSRRLCEVYRVYVHEEV